MPDTLLAAVAAVAEEAGALALRRQAEGFRQWEKSPGHPVCEIDLEVDALIAARLSAIDPQAGWLSEETADSAERLTRSRVWVVDPIDGTRDYLRGRTGWCVSIALVEGGRPLIGVLDAPGRGERWLARAGAGATCNGRALACSQRTELAGARVPAETLPKAEADLMPVPRPNSIALRVAMVADGQVDLCASIRWGHEWDIAAAALIAAEAGATVSNALGEPLRYNSTKGEAFGILAAAPGIHAAAVARLADRARAVKR